MSSDVTDNVARAMMQMRAVGRIDWKQFFLANSVVEKTLRGDPAGIYQDVDFETCDRYRKVVERIARGTGLDEQHVAQRALDQSSRAPEPRGRSGHVGYHLIGEGRADFERQLGYRPKVGERLQRWVFRHASGSYFAGLTVATGVAVVVPAALLSALGAGAWFFVLAMLVVMLPALTLSVTLVQWLITMALPPRILPKMDFEKHIPPECRTAVVIPTLLGDRDDVGRLVRQLELHFLCNSQPELCFVLLADLVDAPDQHMPGDEEVLEAARTGIGLLNQEYAREGHGPFHLLHRHRRWNAREACWMGWERKRGKLEEFNRLLLGDTETSYAEHHEDTRSLEGVRFVITLDSDTVLPRGAAGRLASILGHPLNRAEVDVDTGRVCAGYTVVQPRVEITPGLQEQSRFTSLYGGDGTIDIYTRAVSDVYQDLFGCALYAGKGIYDVEAFTRSLAGREPENAILSHDLWEGLHGRVALATDVVLYEDFPPHYLAYVRRMHRWVRGDWQLLPWLRRRVPAAGGRRLASRFSAIDIWKIVDNLRRSLLSPALLVFLASAWLWLPGRPLLWMLLAVLAPAGQLFTDLVIGLAHGRRKATRRRALRGVTTGLRKNAGRWLLYLVFLPFEAIVTCDAIARTLARVLVTHRRLLQWQSAFQTARLFPTGTGRGATWSEMAGAPLVALALFVAVALVRPTALFGAAPLLTAWLVSPEIARYISQPAQPLVPRLDREEQVKLRLLARRTWLFFETFVGPDEQWLAPDNYQEEPGGELAHRTSPTNIGMMLLSTLAAWDLGFVTVADLSTRIHSSLTSMARLQRYRGHFLNWYDTRTLEPLLPEYVSTVDSGNLGGVLLTLRQGCHEAIERPVLPTALWHGLLDELMLFEGAVEELHAEETEDGLAEVRAAIVALQRWLQASCKSGYTWHRLADLPAQEVAVTELERLLLAELEDHPRRDDAEQLRDLWTWLERLHHHVQGMRRDLEALMPWLEALHRRPAAIAQLALGQERAEVNRRLEEVLAVDLSLGALPEACKRAQPILRRMRGWLENDSLSGKTRAECVRWFEEIEQALATGGSSALVLCGELNRSADMAHADVRAMDFGLLYDDDHHLFHIGYNVTAARIDSAHYDLLASEARLASFIAIAKGDVELRHWFYLGRPLTRLEGGLCLLSWGGTMFEYLMPTLFMVSGKDTLIARSEQVATDEQIQWGERLGLPWGVSESGFFRLDATQIYQYQSFGVPGLGLRRGLENERVVAPYASMLALATRPRAALRNLERLEKLGACGHFGLYEALDFTPERVPEGADFRPVHSYMAHHQGMILVALDNAVNGDIMRRRFHEDTLVQTAVQLLHERVPLAPKVDAPQRLAAAMPSKRPVDRVQLNPWSPVRGAVPEVLALGNGRLMTLITDGGGGGQRWKEWNLTRWVPDATLDHTGYRIHLRDDESGDMWSALCGPDDAEPTEGQATFHPHMAEFHWRKDGLSVRTEIVIAAADDIEIRRVTLANETDRPRRVSVTSHADITLDLGQRFERHPAFSRLFVESEFLPELNALLLRRRTGGTDERPPYLLHRFLHWGQVAKVSGFETSREHFVGRLGSENRPRALHLGLQGHEGAALDTIAALAAPIELPARASEQIAFVTIAGSTRASVMEILRRFETREALEGAFGGSYSESCREAAQLGLQDAELPLAQRLLSRLLHPAAPACVPSDIVAANRLGQPRLWGMGISGDRPLLLLHVRDSNADRLVRQVLRFHHLWRRRGVEVDVVLMQHAVSGYDDDGLSELRNLVAREEAQEWLGLPGGIFLVPADQISSEEIHLLGIVARVVLDSRAGDVASQAPGESAEARSPLPLFPATLPPHKAAPAVLRPDDLLHDNGLGGFTPDGREYVIHLEPGEVTPAPWCNVLSNASFGTLLTESGGGYTWAGNSGENRLTPWTNDPVVDPPGEVLYLRDEDTAEVWTTTLGPAGADATCQVRHGAGYTEFLKHSHGLRQRMRVFVAATDPVKIVRLTLRDTLHRPRRLSATYYAEWVLGSRRSDNVRFIVPEYDARGFLFARNPWNAAFSDRVAFLASDRMPHGFTSDRGEFVGVGGDLGSPDALRRWGLNGEARAGLDPCAALQVHLELEPGGEVTLHFVLGQGDDADHSRDLVMRYREPAVVDEAWRDLTSHWDERLGTVQVRTPEPAMDLLLNRWLLYQTISSRLLGRTGFYQSSGAFGFRDQLQDAMALVHVDPDQLRQHLLECAGHQFEEGDVLHWWHPPAGRGVRTRCSDDMLWLPWVTAFYTGATGDLAVLDEKVPFLVGEPLGDEEHQRYQQFAVADEAVSLFEHCRRSLERGITQGAHGLPLIGDGDWNDGMNRVGWKGRGESVWLAWFVASTVDSFAGLCDHRGEDELASSLRDRAEEIVGAAERAGWDGAWYRRAYDDAGHLLGSAAEEECRIDSIAQSWAVLSGAADAERSRQALRSAERLLVSEPDRLIRLLWPPFDRTPQDPGYIKAYPPGIRENGGQYTHAAIWLAWAFAQRGEGAMAERLFRLMNPILRARTPEEVERYRVEPYVIAADVAGASPHVGRGGWTWYTGSASWAWRLGVEAILGLQRVGGRLRIDPCLPPAWDGFEARVRGPNGGVLQVQVINNDGAGRGVVAVEVDGTAVPTNEVDFPEDGGECSVQVWLGRPRPSTAETGSETAES